MSRTIALTAPAPARLPVTRRGRDGLDDAEAGRGAGRDHAVDLEAGVGQEAAARAARPSSASRATVARPRHSARVWAARAARTGGMLTGAIDRLVMPKPT